VLITVNCFLVKQRRVTGLTSELVWLQHVICVILLNPQVDLLSTTAMGSRLLLAAGRKQSNCVSCAAVC
jgi:hypothetical protein